MSNVFVSRNSILGIDIGSVSLSIVQLDSSGRILRKFYQFHKGNIHDTFSDALNIRLARKLKDKKNQKKTK